MKPIYIIEHLDKALYKWSFAEYKHLSKVVGKNNLWFTNIRIKDKKKLKPYGKVYNQSIKSIIINRKKLCILDPASKNILKPIDKRKFKYFLFGGVLGDYPRRRRTKKALTNPLKTTTRNLGSRQMSTDNAVYTTYKILSGTSFKELKFIDNLEIPKGKYESIILPFRYNLVDKKPFISKHVLEHLKKKRSF